jgi:hypothetical protein
MQVDSNANIPNGNIYEDYSCMLNQTNISFNNNKFYVIQVIQEGPSFWNFKRWGRVGVYARNWFTVIRRKRPIQKTKNGRSGRSSG